MIRTFFSFVAQFIVGYGSPLIFGSALWFILEKGLLYMLLSSPEHHLLIISLISILYMWTQGVAAAWVEIGSDSGVMIDLLVSFVPLVVIILHIYEGNNIHWAYVAIVGFIVLYDLVINTKILFKMARLTSELAKAKP